MNVAYKVFSFEGEKGSWGLFPELCKGCGLCLAKCPKNCLEWSSNLGLFGTPSVEPKMDECSACGICQLVCPDCAITVNKKKDSKV